MEYGAHRYIARFPNIMKYLMHLPQINRTSVRNKINKMCDAQCLKFLLMTTNRIIFSAPENVRKLRFYFIDEHQNEVPSDISQDRC